MIKYQFYYNCSFDLESNFSKYGQLSEKQVNFILTFEEKMKANMIKHKEKIASKMSSSFIGIIGNRQNFNLTILNVKEKELQVSYSNYVTSFKHDLIDADKNLSIQYHVIINTTTCAIISMRIWIFVSCFSISSSKSVNK